MTSFIKTASTTLLVVLTFSSTAQKRDLTVKDIWASPQFYQDNLYGVRSMNNGEHFTLLEKGDIVQYAYKNFSKVKTLVTGSQLIPTGSKTPVSIEDYSFNPTETKVLISTETESIYRHSNKAYYYIYDIKTGQTVPLSDNKLGKQRLAVFSPTNNRIAFVRENNVFIKDLDTDKEIQVTHDGKINEIINGATDWVYEEEFSFDNGIYWNNDGTMLAFYRFDESKVKQFQMAMYGSLYPYQYTFKYPKAGEDNSIVSVHIYDYNENYTTTFRTGIEDDIYFPRIKWTSNSGVLAVFKINRLQNSLEIFTGNFSPNRSKSAAIQTKVVYKETSQTYVDIHDNTHFLTDGKTFLWTSEKSGYNHIYTVDMETSKTFQITKGDFDVTEVYGINEQTKKIYYQAAEDSPMERHVYSINLDGTGKQKLTLQKGTNDAQFSSNFSYFINKHSDANTPLTVTLNQSNGKLIKVLKDNKELRNRLEQYNLSKMEFTTIKNDEGTAMNSWIIKPINFDEKKKYPVFMYVYGGPGINTVNDSWGGPNYMWYQLLAQKGYMVVSVDARGTGYRGEEYKHCTYKQLGKYETEDQIAAAKHLGTLPYVDKSRIGIMGWSYGGYMSSLCITKGADVFKTAIAVAPVTNWRYYDNIYTERFMRTPQENGKNYDENSPINHVSKLKGNYFLIHGSADDNVHYQNAMEMINALVAANKQFDMFIYPDRNHGIYGGNTRNHLFTMMLNYILEKL
ncbi:MAG: S9 family peptidase [Flavobacteriales bacterium]